MLYSRDWVARFVHFNKVDPLMQRGYSAEPLPTSSLIGKQIFGMFWSLMVIKIDKSTSSVRARRCCILQSMGIL